MKFSSDSLTWSGAASIFPSVEPVSLRDMSSQGISWVQAPYGRQENELNKR